MKTRFFAILLCAAMLLLCLCGCGLEIENTNTDGTNTAKTTAISVKDVYIIENIGDKYYIVFNESKKAEFTNDSQLADLSFDSIEDLIDSITNGEFEDWQLNVINNAFPKDENGIKIFDYNHVYYPVIPPEFSNQSVVWSGELYSYMYETLDGSSATVRICTDEVFDATMKREYYDFFDRSTISLEKTVAENEKTIYYFSTSAGQFKEVRYSFENSGIKYTVDERYRLKFNNDDYENIFDLKTSDKVPSQVNLYIEKEDNGQKAIITIFDLVNNVDYSDFAITDKK